MTRLTSSHVKRWDVLGIGCAAVDDLLYVEEFPGPDQKTRVLRSQRQGGGLTATALVAAARAGAVCAYGSQLGFDELSRFTERVLSAENIDLSPLVRRAEAAPVHSTIIVDQTHGTRNIFAERTGETGPAPGHPTDGELAAARVLFIDHHGGENTADAARRALALGVGVVADFERANSPGFEAFFPLADHLIVSRHFASTLTGESKIEAQANALWNQYRAVVVVTAGAHGCWAKSAETGSAPVHFPAFEVPVVDSTGCGDVFHGVYAAALAFGWPLEERIRRASAAAALKAGHAGAQAGIPRREAISAFLASRGHQSSP